MPILLLCRHATNDFVKTGRLPGQLPNIHLNEEGRGQAKALGESLRQQVITAVYASQLERAIETALQVALPHGLNVRIDPRFADTHAGDVGGMVVSDIGKDERYKDAWKIIVDTPTEGRLPGGESLTEMRERVTSALAEIVAAHPDPAAEKDADGKEKHGLPNVLVVVMHADTIKAAISHFLGMPFDHFQRVGAQPASVSSVMVDNACKPLMVNYVNRLPYPA